ncbi:MAG: hypothetical protein K2Q09_07965 [Phycisphaerales bacterium]|nr:hypothetical protein [Phycisphaerales bacterium]
MPVASLISTVKDRAVYAGIRTAIAAATLGEPDATLAGFARLGRLFAGAPFNRKRLDRAVAHLSEAFPQWPDARKRELALRGYEHLAMLGAEMTLTPRLMTSEGWADRARLEEIRPALGQLLRGRPCIMVTGHVGNWEVCGHLMALLGFRMHAIYRPLDLGPLDAWVRDTRSRRGCTCWTSTTRPRGCRRCLRAGRARRLWRTRTRGCGGCSCRSSGGWRAATRRSG